MSAPGDPIAQLLAELSTHWRQGERLPVEAVLRHQSVPPDREAVLDLIYQECCLREQGGERPGAAEYEDRFPHLAAELRDLFEVHRLFQGVQSAPPIGDRPPTLPGFEILRRLGTGGMGVVYLARQQRLDRLVAVKVIRPGPLVGDAVVRRFRREAHIAARLSHPNIVQVFDAEQVDGLPYLVMEYLAGSDLARTVADCGPLPVAAACDCVRQAALGLQHAFERGLVHRDVKPSNLMRSPEGTVKLLDLGLARLRALEGTADDSVLTQGGVLGTPDFMAPEQAEDPRRADVRADLYSLGCTLYFLLTGTTVFPGGTMLQKLDRHRWEASPPLGIRRPDVTPGVAAVVARLLAKRPEERYQTPGELAALLLSLQEGPPSEGRTLLSHPDEVLGIALAPDGRCAMVCRDGRLCLGVEAANSEILRPAAHTNGALAAAFAPDGRRLATSGGDGCVRLWDAHTGTELRCIEAHAGAVAAIAFTPDGRGLLSGGNDQVVRLWNVDTGKELRRIGGPVAERHWDAVVCVAVTPDGRRGLSGSRDRTLRLWDLTTGREVRCLRGPEVPVAAVAVTADGRRALSGGGRAVRLWDLETGELLGRFAGHTGPVLSLAFSGDGRRAVSGSADMTVCVWDVAAGREMCCLRGHTGAVSSVAFVPHGHAVLSGSADRTVRRWLLRD